MSQLVRGRRGLTRAAVAVLLGTCAVFVGALAVAAQRRPLWYDELFSYYIARLGTFGDVLDALLAGADNGPPLDYWARHLCIRALGDNPLAFRLPSLLALAFGSLALYRFASRRMVNPAAAAALVLPFGTLAAGYAIEGRAYMPMFALAALSLLAWQRAVEQPRPGRLLLLSIALAASPLTHYYGVLNYLPVIVGEVVRTIRCRRMSAPILASIGLSLLSLALLPPFARHAAEMKQYFWASHFGWASLAAAYVHLSGASLIPAVALVAVAVGYVVVRLRRTGAGEGLGVGAEQAAAAVTLVLTPASVWVMAALYTHAATDRYGIAAIAGLSLLCAEGVQVLAKLDRRLAWASTSALLACAILTVSGLVRSVPGEPIPRGATDFVAAASLPIAVDSPQLYLKAFHYLPEASRHKIIYLTDREASRRYLGYDNDEISIPNLRSVVALETKPFSTFAARQPQFYVFAQSYRFWLLAQLAADSAKVDSIAQFGGIKVFHVVRR